MARPTATAASHTSRAARLQLGMAAIRFGRAAVLKSCGHSPNVLAKDTRGKASAPNLGQQDAQNNVASALNTWQHCATSKIQRNLIIKLIIKFWFKSTFHLTQNLYIISTDYSF